jgi:hypothetical protein
MPMLAEIATTRLIVAAMAAAGQWLLGSPLL